MTNPRVEKPPVAGEWRGGDTTCPQGPCATVSSRPSPPDIGVARRTACSSRKPCAGDAHRPLHRRRVPSHQPVPRGSRGLLQNGPGPLARAAGPLGSPLLAGCRGAAPLGLRPIHPGIFSARRRAGRVRAGAPCARRAPRKVRSGRRAARLGGCSGSRPAAGSGGSTACPRRWRRSSCWPGRARHGPWCPRPRRRWGSR